MNEPSLLSRFRGCLLGGAAGDALGAPVEFLSLREIRQQFGPRGITRFAPAYGRTGAITDDTQMTLFTAEGLLRSDTHVASGKEPAQDAMVWHAYLRWLETQGARPAVNVEYARDGWLLSLPELHDARAPGNTCLSALASGRTGSPYDRINDSKGCGGVMRSAPVALWHFAAGAQDPGDAFDLGVRLAALTHGHPTGYLAAGCLAASLRAILGGESVERAIAIVLPPLELDPDGEECRTAIEQACVLASDGAPSPEKLETLGRGFVAEEALAIAYYCALAADGDFRRAIELAVNHSGDSDSTGAITGNLVGALLGSEAIPAEWLEPLELRATIDRLAHDLYHGYDDSDDWKTKYPGR